LHARSRTEVARADHYLPRTLAALRELVEVEILRASREFAATEDFRWKLANAWMMKNLAVHATVPALCDYLRMSPNTLHRFFKKRTGLSPGTYFRLLKLTEARRLIYDEQWQVKAAAYHLGYRHPNDLSRALSDSAKRVPRRPAVKGIERNSDGCGSNSVKHSEYPRKTPETPSRRRAPEVRRQQQEKFQ
jgi:AraC-like DNA-binding protein